MPTTSNTIKFEHIGRAIGATISDAGDVSDPRTPLTPPKLVRNGKTDTYTDYLPIFNKLQIKEDFEQEFFEIMKEFRSRPDVREALEDAQNDLKAISEDFLKTYGKKIWMLKGENNKQDPKYKEIFFKWNIDEDT